MRCYDRVSPNLVSSRRRPLGILSVAVPYWTCRAGRVRAPSLTWSASSTGRGGSARRPQATALQTHTSHTHLSLSLTSDITTSPAVSTVSLLDDIGKEYKRLPVNRPSTGPIRASSHPRCSNRSRTRNRLPDSTLPRACRRARTPEPGRPWCQVLSQVFTSLLEPSARQLVAADVPLSGRSGCWSPHHVRPDSRATWHTSSPKPLDPQPSSRPHPLPAAPLHTPPDSPEVRSAAAPS